MKNLKSYQNFLNESNNMFAGYSLEYWKNYMDGEYVYTSYNDKKLENKITSIINEYRYEDGENNELHKDDENFNLELLTNNMRNLAHWLILTYGFVDAGSLSAFCMQNFTSNDVIPAASKKLLDVNTSTGVFEV